eukprot:TRINITY_DN5541_c0_g1_i1.p1 TRINITY_DN5541_c0_g1~~TRINITY_DN5541_c0_g1_i1.p1  ORF type:complete len:412 (+),score=82.52 TRINITY_DN5541_c0_g1_i1:48-1283(+)
MVEHPATDLRAADLLSLVAGVKEEQRGGEAARRAWRIFCDLKGNGIRDPQKHDSEFLRGFLQAFRSGNFSCIEDVADSDDRNPDELVVVERRLPSLGSNPSSNNNNSKSSHSNNNNHTNNSNHNHLVLQMPRSETGIVKEVVESNTYGFAPGRGSFLREGDVVLDIGAHVGVAAALALCTKETQVICVEPHPVTFEILKLNMSSHGTRVTLVNKAVSDSSFERPFFAHAGTNNPSRLFFASLFDTRAHSDWSMTVQCVHIQDLVSNHKPTVVKLDAEGAEKYLTGITNFQTIRAMVVEWDWTHNRHCDAWQQTEAHLKAHGFTVKLKNRKPNFDDTGNAILTDSKGKKRGKTGMVFTAVRKVADQGPSLKSTSSRAEAERRNIANGVCEPVKQWLASLVQRFCSSNSNTQQ